MADVLLPSPTRQRTLFPDVVHLDSYSSSSSTPPHPAVAPSLPSFSRGPMYSVYAELRDWKLRMKKAGLSSSTPIPVQVNRTAAATPMAANAIPDLSMNFRTDNRKPPSTAQRPKQELRRMGSMSACRGEEKRGGPPRGGSGRAEEFLMMRDFCSYQETATRREDEVRDGVKKGIFTKTMAGFRRSKTKPEV
ncbi:hypothetical protein HPP92_021502 [Vanilla planifolia]|uniref:Uncharacterized protein n=1 Tax=Vanilla planifolia TaxID=51239 RepID=A0A835PYT5_VANPL|nr:hypothetical protein HPP92_021866 [Vanilla planifolia]KAG0463026.1 hypothetical protein HPP92_021502 [Vanilla planifolia]